MFKETYGLEKTKVGFCVGRQDYPPFSAQLGCQGLVIFDGEGRIAVGCSPALNRVGVVAFKKVDATVLTLAEDCGMDESDLVDGEARVYATSQELQGDVFDSNMRAEERRRNAAKRPAPQEKNPLCAVPPEKRCPPVRDDASDEKKRLGEVPSVGHDEMDHEHAACADAFERLERERTVEALRDLISLLTHHFEHEEALMQSSGFGAGAPAGLSPLESHKTDHARILDLAEAQLSLARELAKKAGGGSGPFVPASCAKSIADLFEVHATEFDSRYEGILS